MLLVVDGWTGVWSSLLGGVVSGVTVVVGVFLAQHLSDVRKRAADVRMAADALLVEVSNSRDAAVRSRSKSRSGRYDLWPLRHQIHLSHSLRGRPVLQAAENYYNAVWKLRDWVRNGPVAQGDRPKNDPEMERAFASYARVLDERADLLIDALKNVDRPTRRTLIRGRPPHVEGMALNLDCDSTVAVAMRGSKGRQQGAWDQQGPSRSQD